MSAGWVLVQTSDDVAPEIAGELARLPGVERAEQTVGAYDVVVRVTDVGVATTGAPEPSAKRIARAALRIPGVTVAVCCHDGPVGDEDVPRDRTIDLTDEVFAQSSPAAFDPLPSGGIATL